MHDRSIGKFVYDIVIAVVGGVAVGVSLIIFSPLVVERFAIVLPSCDNPVGLSSMRLDQMYRDHELTIKASSVAIPPQGYQRDLWKAANVIDGSPGTPWVPDDHDNKRRLTLSFNRKHDPRLICVVNGQASDSWSYLRSQRIRTAYVYTHNNSGLLAPLRTLGEYDLQNRQPLNFTKGKTKSITIEITQVYQGRKVYDPDQKRYVDPVHHVALGEIEIYEKDPHA